MHLPPFKAILAFDAGARHGSSSKAAQELKIEFTQCFRDEASRR